MQWLEELHMNAGAFAEAQQHAALHTIVAEQYFPQVISHLQEAVCAWMQPLMQMLSIYQAHLKLLTKHSWVSRYEKL